MIFPLLLAMQAAPRVIDVPLADGPARSSEVLTTWQLAEVRCAGEPVSPLRAETPLAGLDWGASGEGRVVLDFRIDQEGRTFGIGPSAGFGSGRDLAPALAATRFSPGRPRTACVAHYRFTRTPVAQAPIPALIGYTVFPQQRPTNAVWQRIRPAGDCFSPAPALRNRAFPDFKSIPQPPATLGWSMIGYDLDAGGRPVREHLVAGTGNAALDRASLKAVAASRFERGVRKGCLYPYWRRGDVPAAPTAIDKESLRPAGATCPATVDWAQPPILSYPDAFRRRGIEGWAVVAYDVAPWGETGNVRVLAAEPAAAFGEEAVSIIRRARTKPGPGGTGCVERVRFAMGVEGGRGQVPAEATARPY